MIRSDSRPHPIAALLLRRLLAGNDHACPRVALDSRRPLRDADSAYRNRPTAFVAPSIASQTNLQRTSATDRQPRNPHSA
jgi:hypothetical protein